MNKEQKLVQDWHMRFSLLIEDKPRIPDPEIARLRISLIHEEAAEFKQAAYREDLVAVADALADLLYVVYGTAVSYGIDMEPVFAEVHRSNMSKGDPAVIRSSYGKILKSKNWTPPNLRPLIFDAKPEDKRK